MTIESARSPYRMLVDTAMHWMGEIVWLLPHQVSETQHEPVTGPIQPPVAPTRRDAAVPTHPERINDWPGSDASGEGTSIWHEEGRQWPAPTAESPMTDQQFSQLMSALNTLLAPVRALAEYQLAQAKQPLPAAPTTRSILAEQAAASIAAEQPTFPANPGPYSAVLVKGVNGGPDLWDVVGATGSTGFIHDDVGASEADAKAYAAKLNAAMPVPAIPPRPVVPVKPLGVPAGPYSATLVKGVAGAPDEWDVVGANGVTTGFIRDEVGASELEAKAYAAKLNAAMPGEIVTHGTV